MTLLVLLISVILFLGSAYLFYIIDKEVKKDPDTLAVAVLAGNMLVAICVGCIINIVVCINRVI